jgi:ABC-type molybdate transport system substrate-binding protein
VNVIRLPAWAQPKVQYGIAVVTASAHRPAAQTYIAKLLGKAAQAKLLAAGFLPRVKRR